MFATMLCAVPWWANALGILFVAVCLIMIALVLLQKGRGGGLAAAFGGEGGQSAFGSKTGDVFTWVTIVVVVAFFLIAMLLALGYKPADLDKDVEVGSSFDNTASKDVEKTETESGEAASETSETSEVDGETTEEEAVEAEESAPSETPVETEADTTE